MGGTDWPIPFGSCTLVSIFSFFLSLRTGLWGGLFLTLVISGIGITFSLPAGILLAWPPDLICP
jgi:hypothetical protein